MEWITRNKKAFSWIFAIIVFLILTYLISYWIKEKKLELERQTKIQTLRESPAAEYCENNWWIVEIKTDNEIYWVCNFEDWSACEILEYFRWECLSDSENSDVLYCSDWLNCKNEEPEDLNSWIENINNIENINEEILDDDDLDEIDIDSLYDYYENEFSNTWKENWVQPSEKLKLWEDAEEQISSACDWVWGEVINEKCFLSNWIEIAF